jgi:heptosyltransferase-3
MSDSHRGRLFASLTRAKKRYTIKLVGKLNRWEKLRFTAESTVDWEYIHRVERDYFSVREFLPLRSTQPGPLVFDRDRTEPWPDAVGLTNFCLMQVGTWKDYGRWPKEQWREVAVYLLEHFDHIIISGGVAPRELEDALWLQQQLGPRVVCTLGKTTWAQVAWLLNHSALYVGVDTAAMHLAAACGRPIVAKFTTTEDRWFPWQTNFRAVLPPSYITITDQTLRKAKRREPKGEEITAQQMIAACEEMLKELQPSDRAGTAPVIG